MRMVDVSAILGACLLCAGCSAVMLAVLPIITRRLRLERANYAGQPIRTGYGLALWLPAALAQVWLSAHGQLQCAPAAAALVSFGLVGLADDLWGDRRVGGFRGHLTCWSRDRRITTGLLKMIVGGVTALALGLWLSDPSTGSPRRGLGMLMAAALIALSANTFNLFDLRPLRTLKLFAVGCVLLGCFPFAMLSSRPAPPAVASVLLGPVAIAGVLYAPLEARRLAMLGDTGANALGAIWGVAACAMLPLSGQLLLGALLAALNGYSERHSITDFIQSHPLLDRLDRWGVSG